VAKRGTETDRWRAAVLLKCDGLSPAQVAAVLGFSVRTIYRWRAKMAG